MVAGVSLNDEESLPSFLGRACRSTAIRVLAVPVTALATLASSVSPAIAQPARHNCTQNLDWDWHTSTRPNWSQADWESTGCGYAVQQRSDCAQHGTTSYLSGVVTGLEVETRATCPLTSVLVACFYHVKVNGTWQGWVSDCSLPVRRARR